LNNNKIKKLPPGISEMAKLERVEVGMNLLGQEEGSDIFLLSPQNTSLTEINIFGNKLDSIPSTMPLVTSLRKIWMGYNLITQLLPQFSSLSNLTELSMAGNCLNTWPEQIFSLTNLIVTFLLFFSFLTWFRIYGCRRTT